MELRSSNQGFLAPQVSLSATNVAAPISSPFNGLMIYNTNATGSGTYDVQPGYYYWNGTSWTRFMNGNSSVISGSGAPTQVAFWDGTNSLSSDADLYWDNSVNKRLGVGTANPQNKLHVNGGIRWGGDVAAPYIYSNEDPNGIYFEQVGTTTTNSKIRLQSSPSGSLSTYAQFYIDPVNGFSFMSNAGGNSGNVGIGTATPSQKLDVAGGSIRTTHQLMSTVATGTSPLAVTSTTLNTNLNADMLDGWHASQLQFQQSNRDFPNGTLIQTDIDYSGVSGDPWLLEIEGNAYGNLVPIDIKIQGYFWTSTMINVGGISNGTNITGISLFNYGGKLCFWFPNQAYWQGYSVFVNDNYAGIKHNRLVSITHEAKPLAISREVALTSVIRQSWHSGNFDPTTYTPTTGGTGYIQNQVAADQAAGFRINGNGLFNGGSVGIGTTAPGGYRLNVQGGSIQSLIQSSSDAPLVLRGTDAWSGITFSDVNNSDNLWYNGQNSTFAIGGGGSNVAGKKLHIDGATSIGSTYDGNSAPTDGLIVQGNVGIGTDIPVAKLELEGTSANWNETTPGQAVGSLHLDPGSATDHFGSAITWGASDAGAGDNAHAGIYVRSDGSYGTKMYFGTTDSYAVGSKTRMMIDNLGKVGIGVTSPSQALDVVGDVNSSTGYRIGNSAATGEYLRGTGTRFVSSAIQVSDVPTLNQNTTGYANEAYYLRSPFPYNVNITDATTAASLSEPNSRTSVNMHATHGLFGSWATTLTMSGYERYGAYQISGNYNSATPRLAMRNYVQSTNTWNAWTELLTTANIGSYGDNLGNHTATTTLNMNANQITNVGDILSTNNYGTGLVGVYSDTRYQNVFAMGTAYRLAADGTSTGNMYGLAWTHSNIGGQSKAGLGHQLLAMSAGTTTAAMGNGFWTNYDITGNRLLDQNDANYYVDPASNSVINTVRVAGGSPAVGKVLTSTDASGNANWAYPGNPWEYVGNDVREVCNTAYREEFEWGITYNNSAPILRVTCNGWNSGQRVCSYPPYPTGDVEPFTWGGVCWIWGTSSTLDDACSRYRHMYYTQDANGKYGMASGNGCDANPGVYRRRL